mmetsp:Transcript_36437/g.85491  ORF Transcript_36437/g.85491 Transcript_36437/m.85491 type:complete len:225 (-) Transcript_36437:478-1152(-)
MATGGRPSFCAVLSAHCAICVCSCTPSFQPPLPCSGLLAAFLPNMTGSPPPFLSLAPFATLCALSSRLSTTPITSVSMTPSSQSSSSSSTLYSHHRSSHSSAGACRRESSIPDPTADSDGRKSTLASCRFGRHISSTMRFVSLSSSEAADTAKLSQALLICLISCFIMSLFPRAFVSRAIRIASWRYTSVFLASLSTCRRAVSALSTTTTRYHPSVALCISLRR